MNVERRPARRETASTNGWAADTHYSQAGRGPRFTCELCCMPAPLVYDVLTPWLVAAVCAVCEPAIRDAA